MVIRRSTASRETTARSAPKADNTRAAILTPGMIESGMDINAGGSDGPGKTELHPDVLRGRQVRSLATLRRVS